MKSLRSILVTVVCVVVFGRWGWVSFQHLEARRMADELCVPGNFWGAPIANHGNTAFIFGERSENGINVYLNHDATNKVLIGEFSVGHFNALTLRLLDWSPDDKFCAYTRDGGVFIHEAVSGKQVAALNNGGEVVDFAWLSPSSFVAFDGFNLSEFDNQPTGWSKRRLLTLTNTQPVSSFSALSDHCVLWRQASDIWMYDLRSELPARIWHAGTNKLTDFSLETHGKILLDTGRNGGALMELNPYIRNGFNSDAEAVKNAGVLDTNNGCVFKVFSINDDKGRVYMTTDTLERDMSLFSSAKDKTMYVKKNDTAQAVQVLGRREAIDYSVQGNVIYAVGSQSNEPPRLWRYDMDTDSLTCIYSSLPNSKYAKFVQAQYCTITNAEGNLAVSYRLWPPVHVVPGKKYPLMIEQTAYKWQAEPQVAANCGWYFAIASRPAWGSARLHNWGSDVMAAYHELAKNPNIDTNHVFLYGVSAEAGYADALLVEESALWRGAFLDGASGPEPSLFKNHPLNMGVVVGKEDSGLKWISDYQERVFQSGQSATVVLKDGGHSWLSGNSERVSARALAEFLIENQ